MTAGEIIARTAWDEEDAIRQYGHFLRDRVLYGDLGEEIADNLARRHLVYTAFVRAGMTAFVMIYRMARGLPPTPTAIEEAEDALGIAIELLAEADPLPGEDARAL